MKRVLVLRGGALGDFLVTLPALALLRGRWPDARIEVVGNAPAAQLAVNRGLVDVAHSQHAAKWSALYGTAPLPAEFADWLDGFDLIVNFWPDRGGELRRRFPRHPGQRFLFAGAMPTLAPASAHYCEPLSVLGLHTGKFVYTLTTHRPGRRVVALHPGSGSPAKNWPVPRWRELAEELHRDVGAQLLIVTGEADETARAALADLGTPLHDRPLEELVTELARATVFIGHDSGVSHLAAACETPSVLLFGPTDPAIWAPPAPHVRVLRRGPDLGAISVADVIGEVAPILKARG